MSDKDNGGPVFPIVSEAHEFVLWHGISLRDYFAGKAIQGLLGLGYTSDEVAGYASSAFVIADAMLKARQS